MVFSAVRIPSKKLPANAAVIVLHGLGDTGSGWKFLADFARQSPAFDQVKFVFPNAPTIPITCNQGFPMPGWFDLYDIPNITKKPDVQGFMKSCDVVKELIKEQTDAGIAPERIILGGFSQGAALVLATAATLEFKIGGFMALSGFCPVEDALRPKLNKTNVDTPIFQGHGTADPIVDYNRAKSAIEFFEKEVGFTNLNFKTYPGMGHSTCEEELAEIFQFMAKVLN